MIYTICLQLYGYPENINDFRELIEVSLETNEGKSAAMFICGILLILLGFIWLGLLCTVCGFICISGALFPAVRALRQIPSIDAILPSSLLIQTKETLRYDIENYVPLEHMTRDSSTLFPNINILLMGPIGAGKSSFFNTVHTVLQDRIFNVALSGSTDQSLTMKFSRYPVYSSKRKDPLRFTLCDTQGLEPNHFMTDDNMRFLLEGYVPDKYPLDPNGRYMTDSPGFIKDPSLLHKMHCVVIVMDASIIDAVDAIQETVNNVKAMQKVANKYDVPQVVVLTKIDKLCKLVYKDASYAMKSKKVFNTVSKAADLFGLPRHNVFPMKNYEKECEVDPNVDILTLLTLKGILNQVDASLLKHFAEIKRSFTRQD
ncbi:Interferon-induced protein 44-like [Mactra antiquata]